MRLAYSHIRLSILQTLWGVLLMLLPGVGYSQADSEVAWIRPSSENDHSQWGIENGIVIGLWPTAMEKPGSKLTGGPRGLFRIGYHFQGTIYQLNFIAVEPVVDGQLEFSEISPSKVDGQWGKLMWAGATPQDNRYMPYARTRGEISQPDPANPQVEALSFYVFMEEFLNGAHPYFKISIRSDRPQELEFQIFHHQGSAPMQRCVLTATMGNYARLRQLHLQGEVVDSRELYEGFDGIDFIEKPAYPLEQLARTSNGDVMALMTSNETFSELAHWPQSPQYLARQSWRYRPFYQLTQYWRKPAEELDPSLQLRVNGRAHYWAVASDNKADYVAIPGGPSFENFEMRQNYVPGQRYYFGLSRSSPAELLGLEPE